MTEQLRQPTGNEPEEKGFWKNEIDRRRFINRSLLATLGGASLAGIAAACGGDDDVAAPAPAPAPEPAPEPAPAPPPAAEPAPEPAPEPPPEPAPEPPPPPELPTTTRLAISGEVRGLDPDGPDQNNIPSVQVMMATYDYLTDFVVPKDFEEAKAAALAGLEPVPALAESWEVSADGLTYRFNLRDGVVSQYGNPLNPESFRFMIEKTVTAGATGAFILGLIGGVGDPGQLTAVDDLTFDITLNEPNPLFLLAIGTIWTVAYDTIELQNHITDDDPYASEWLADNTAGFGPYVVESIEQDGKIVTLQARDGYWGAKPTQTVVQQDVTEQATRLQLLLNQETDYAENLTPTQQEEVASSDVAHVIEFVSTHANHMSVTQEPPWDDPAIRQGIAMAIPYDDIATTVFRGTGQTWKSAYAPWIQGYVEDFAYQTDIAAATAALAPVSGETLTFNYSDAAPASELIAILVQASLAEAGLNIELEKLPTGVWDEQLRNRPTDLPNHFHHQNAPLYPTPYYALFLCCGTGGFDNYHNYLNEEMDELLAELKVESDAATIEELARRGQEIAMRDLPVIPIHWTGQTQSAANGLDVTQSFTGVGLVKWQNLGWSA